MRRGVKKHRIYNVTESVGDAKNDLAGGVRASLKVRSKGSVSAALNDH
jgi:hypothetical protein